jgi:hypothetical protein
MDGYTGIKLIFFLSGAFIFIVWIWAKAEQASADRFSRAVSAIPEQVFTVSFEGDDELTPEGPDSTGEEGEGAETPIEPWEVDGQGFTVLKTTIPVKPSIIELEIANKQEL